MFSRVPHTNGVRLPRWTGLFLAVVLLPFVSGTSKASCGDYVHIATPSQSPQTQATGSENPPVAHVPGTPSPTKTPCQGPNCSQKREPMPPLPAPVPTVPTVDQ